MIHHNTIRTYTAILLDLFNDIEIQYKLSDGSTKTRKVPLVYSTVEKIKQIDNKTLEQLLSGNTNLLPRAGLSLQNISKNSVKTTNKYNKVNTLKSKDEYQFSWNSVPYIFNYQLIVQCRGMNEVSKIIEQICPKFNPTIHIDTNDALNLNEETRIAISLEDVSFENDEYNETSSNVFNVIFSLKLEGFLYPPIREIHKIKEYKIYLNEDMEDDTYIRKDILNWDIEDGKPINLEIVNADDNHIPEILDLVPVKPLIVGDNEIIAEFEDKDNKYEELTFEYTILFGEEFVENMYQEKEKLKFKLNSSDAIFELQCKITDCYKNYSTFSKKMSIST